MFCLKIESEEYEEALSLAHTYGLDTDLVYQRQWRKSAVNVASIQNYLVMLRLLAWVLFYEFCGEDFTDARACAHLGTCFCQELLLCSLTL